MKFVDFFSGTGGFHMGFGQAGHECVGWCEIDRFARKSYEAIYDTEGLEDSMRHDFTTCKKCGALIRFVTMKSGKQMPVNDREIYYTPDPDGKDKIVTPSGDVVSGAVLSTTAEIDAQKDVKAGYISHFATCPAAGNFGRR